jgi:hypothetical protein
MATNHGSSVYSPWLSCPACFKGLLGAFSGLSGPVLTRHSRTSHPELGSPSAVSNSRENWLTVRGFTYVCLFMFVYHHPYPGWLTGLNTTENHQVDPVGFSAVSSVSVPQIRITTSTFVGGSTNQMVNHSIIPCIFENPRFHLRIFAQ